MTEQNYRGSCQCQAVQFEAPLDLDHSITCNFSRCQRIGAVLAFTPREKFVLFEGDGATKEFLFNQHRIRHQFCTTCGVEAFAYASGKDGTPMVAVNVNCLDGVDPRALSPKHYDGRSA